MAVRLYFIVEGQTEETFVNRILKPHLATYSVWCSARCVMTSRSRRRSHRGGVVRYEHPKRDITAWMNEDNSPGARFTTMFDLYGLPVDFPGSGEASSVSDPYERVEVLESALSQDVSDRRFIPYIQLHEFEALLFASPRMLETQFHHRREEIDRLVETASAFDSPELIDDGKNTAPSKRIISMIPEYERRKVSAGPIVAAQIGLPTLRTKCKHFGEWLSRLESK